MVQQLVALILDEGKWLTASMGLALVAVALLLYARRHESGPARVRILAAMSLFFGVTIGNMAFGHLLAITVKLAQGTLGGSLLVLYAIGVALAVPSWWLIAHTRRVLDPGDGHRRATLGLNAWLALTLLALGPHNLPLAAPGFLNIAYLLHERRPVGWAIVTIALAANLGLFVASLVFLASGQSFEQFRGIS